MHDKIRMRVLTDTQENEHYTVGLEIRQDRKKINHWCKGVRERKNKKNGIKYFNNI